MREFWPEHNVFINKSFAERSIDVMQVSETVANCVLNLSSQIDGGLDQLCEDYRFLCEAIILPEEFHFRRYGTYRLSSFAEAMRECYANAPFMARYVNGILMSTVFWKNHAQAMSSYVLQYLPSLKSNSDLLEIGPGHGLFLYFAAKSPSAASVSGWDVSPTSIEHTRQAIDVLGIQRPVELTLQNVLEARPNGEGRLFDAITMSEVLEHLEDPVAVLRMAREWLRPGGTVWVNVPANSPAPDHIYLFHSPEHACEVVREAGFEIAASHAFPMTGATLERARKGKLTISCIVVGYRSS
ncbi:MAG TPA: class I SAM-dependent methyltransferase [Rhizomicrobium sp.]|nr:class I SAM-dependent methyltransferase [Rhizomicrobium sp.]